MDFSKLKFKLTTINTLLFSSVVILLVVCFIMFCSCSTFKGSKNPILNEIIQDVSKEYNPDGVIEKAVTQEIEKDTGLDVDLSPRQITPEQK